VTGPTAAQELQDALQKAADALEGGPAPAAAAAMSSAADLCAQAERAGARFSARDLDLARSLWERCGQAAERHALRLEASLLQLSTSRRAVGAYRCR
jgi:hypothetical protein